MKEKPKKWYEEAMERQDAANEFVHKHSAGPGGVGRGQPDQEPLFTEGVEIKGKSDNEVASIYLSTATGRLVILPGTNKETIDSKTIRKVLSPQEKRQLREALKISRKINPQTVKAHWVSVN